MDKNLTADTDFNPDRNKFVIDQVMKNHERMREKKMKEFEETLAERVDAAGQYLRHISDKGTPIEKYFGRQELAHLQGRRIIEKIVNAGGQKVIQFETI